MATVRAKPSMPTSTFLHPAIAMVAVGSALLPVAIHLLHRRRFRRERWAAMEFLLAANRRSARRIRLEQWLLLLLRIAVVTGLGLAVARPFFPAAVLGALGRARSHHVLLIDNSASMRIAVGPGAGRGVSGASGIDASRLDRMMAMSSSIIDAVPPGDGISLVRLAAPASALSDHPAYDRRGVRDQLSRVTATWRGTDISGGLGAALDIVRRGQADFPPGNQFVYVLSDQPGREWLRPSGDAAGASSIACRVAEFASLIVVEPDEPAANVAVTGLRATSTLAGAELPLRFEGDVANFGNRTVRDAALRLSLDDRIVHRMVLPPLGPGESTTAGANVILSHAGPHTVSATVVTESADDFPQDNVRLLALDVDDAVPVLLVDAHSAPDALKGSSGYLAVALSPGADSGRRRSFLPRRLSWRDVGGEPLDGYAVAVLCGVPPLEDETWRRLESFVEAGGGLLVFAGNGVDTVRDNERGYRGGAGLLPCAWGEVAASPPITGDASGAPPGGSVGFAADGSAHPVLVDFAGAPDSSLFQARVERYLRVDGIREGTEIPLRYTDGSPAFLVAARGRGMVGVVTTSADMEWTNLPARGDYVSLMVNLCVYLTRGRGASRTYMVGDMVRHPIPASASGFAPYVTRPDQRSQDARVLVEEGVYVVEFGPVEEAGVYTLTLGPRQTTVAVNPDPSESDTRPVVAEALRAAMACEAEIVTAGALTETILRGHRSSELGDRMLFIVLLLLVAESWLAAKWGAFR